MEYYISNGELHHWGIKGMRWGQRRYQNKDGSLTPAGRKRYEKEMERLKAEKRKIRNEKATANKLRKLEELQKDVDAKKKALAEEKKHNKSETEKKLTPEEEKAKYEADKKHAIEKGDAKEVLKFKGDLTQQEMQAAKARLQWEQDVRNFIPKDEDEGKTAAEKVFDKVNHGVKYAGIGIKAYNTAINIVNAFSNNPVPLPKIELDVVKGNKDDRLKKKKEKEKADHEEAEARAKEAAEKKAERVKQKESEKAAKEAQEKVNRYNERWYENDESVRAKNRSSEYNMKGEDVYDSKLDTRTGRMVVPEMRLLSAPVASTPAARIDSGRNYIAGLLEAPKK